MRLRLVRSSEQHAIVGTGHEGRVIINRTVRPDARNRMKEETR